MFLSKYGVARHVYLPMVKRSVVDHAVGADWTPVAGDVKISKDGGATANVTNLPTAIAMGNSAIWDFSLTATEMQAAQIVVTIADSTTKAVEDNGFEIETYGNASAQHVVDLSDGVRAGLTALPNAAAGASGGLPLSVDTSGRVDVLKINGTSQTARDLGASVLLSSGTGTGQLDFTSGVVKANATQWLGGAIPAVNVTGVPLVDLKYTLGTISPATAGSVRADAVTGAVGSVTGLTASNLDAAVSTRMATYTQPTGFLAATFPASVASPTNITAGTITTVTNLTNAPTSGDFTSAMKTSLNAATPASVVGAVGSVAGNVGGNVVGSIGSLATQAKADVNAEADTALADYDGPTHAEMTAELAIADDATLAAIAALNNLSAAGVRTELSTELARIDVANSTRLATAGYTAPDNADILLIKAKTDNLPSDPADESLIIAATDAIFSRIGAPAGASIADDISNISSGGGLDAAGVRAAIGMANADLDIQLSGIDTDVLTRLPTSSYTAPLTAAGTRTALGLGSANLDIQLDAIPTNAELTAAIPTAVQIRTEIDSNSTKLTSINNKTTNLPSDPADASDIASAFSTVNSTLATIVAYIDTEIAAIKLKTDNLPSDPADASDIAASFSGISSTLATIATYIDTEVAAIKTKTDQMSFTLTNKLDVNIQAVADDEITGSGTTLDKWRPV